MHSKSAVLHAPTMNPLRHQGAGSPGGGQLKLQLPEAQAPRERSPAARVQQECPRTCPRTNDEAGGRLSLEQVRKCHR